jgi:ribose/xylose/arabinose/galactoside ABC-type transport system permease subunit
VVIAAIRDGLRRFGPLVGLVTAWCLFALLAGKPFWAVENQRLLLLQTSVVGVAAIGATFVIVAGGIDLAVGSTIAATGMLAALVLRAGHGAALASATALLGGALIGFVTSQLVNRRLGLSPFIATLALWGAVRGAAKGLGGNQPVYPDSLGWLDGLMQPAPSGLAHWFPPGVLVWLALAALGALVLRTTVYGRHVYALGSNAETARLCGVDLDRTRLWVYLGAGACAAVAGLLQLSYLHMGDPTTASGYELRVIAAVVIGGASLSGGQGSVGGTVIGALLMTIVDNGCTQLGLGNWVQEIATGVIVALAVALDRWRGHRGV